MADSLEKYNVDRIPFYLSCPCKELPLFQNRLQGYNVRLLTDEEISSKTVGGEEHLQKKVEKLPPHLVQQLIKAEFWRMEISPNYLIIDSDSYFIRPFFLKDFLVDDYTPYTILHQSKDLLSFAARQGRKNIIKDYYELRELFKDIFKRTGCCFDFGPTPVVWSSRVWRALYEEYVVPNKTNMIELISNYPCEILWYGEYLLKSRVIPIIPLEPLFKVYHYKKQFDESIGLGENETVLSENYLGIVEQSNWSTDKQNRIGTKSFFKKIFKRGV
ncbi:MAG: hypothetical protein HUN04_06610 [Desulfobacter sp.]|nr:MAG: hypothetical protein HUN04_06610 [Desulfobacter sp.]